MNDNRIIGRKYEQQLLESVCEQREARMVAVYGRRRVGKTFLVREFFHNEFDFMFTGSYETPMAVQLSLFQRELQKRSGQDLRRPANWFEAFEQLQAYLGSLRKERIVVFFDELPWMDTPKSKFLTAFSYFWNTWASTRDGLKLFICGSSTSWMMNKVIGDKGGLYNRCSRTIYLAPFTLGEMEAQLEQKGIVWTRYQITEAYMIFGGIPYYIDMLDKNLTFAQNIDRLCFSKGGELASEYESLYKSLFDNEKPYLKIIAQLAANKKGLTRVELTKKLKTADNGHISNQLEDLENCDLIRRYHTREKKIKATGGIFQLTDFFTLFHLTFASKQFEDQQYWLHHLGTPTVNTWYGHAFERLCMAHIPQIKKALRIDGIGTEYYAWRSKAKNDKTQIDLIIERADKMINLCEIKYSEGAYLLDKEEAAKIRKRRSAFVEQTGTRCGILPTLITANGASQNSYVSEMAFQLTLDDLFED